MRDSESATNKLLIAAFDQVYKKHSGRMAISVLPLTFEEDSLEPILQVLDKKTDQILAQVFNVIDTIGGKQAISVETIEKFLVSRGIIEPLGTELTQVLRTQKEREQHQFVTEGSHLAGEAYQLDEGQLAQITEALVEMDEINEIQLDPATYKYPPGLTQVFREVEDPFESELGELVFNAQAEAGTSEN